MRELMRPGRPRCPRRIETEPSVTYFKPRGVPMSELDVVQLSLEELEVIRLSDLEGLGQEETAIRMGISRRAIWEDLQNARRKIAEALVKGKAIEIKGGDYTLVGRQLNKCHGCQAAWESPSETHGQMQCPFCGSTDFHPCPDERDRNGPKSCCHGRSRKGEQDEDAGDVL
jgi:predicted DNA-binding protein (UPF0251 family)